MKHCTREKWETKVMSNSYTECMPTKKAILTHFSNLSSFVLQCQIKYLWWEWQEVKCSVDWVQCALWAAPFSESISWHHLGDIQPPKGKRDISAWVCAQPVIFSRAALLYFTVTGICPPGIGVGTAGHWQRGRNSCYQSRIYKDLNGSYLISSETLFLINSSEMYC